MSDTIPGPPSWPFIGNILDVRNAEYPLMALTSLADQYGPIYQLTLGGNTRLFVSSCKLLDELCDEKRFRKTPPAALESMVTGPAGLFVARSDDPYWGLAHRVLMPAFGPLAISDMFDDMHDLAKQLTLSWARKGPNHRIDGPGDFTRLTLDTIALCAMDYRFNSFYQEQQHPFVEAMITVLTEASQSRSRLPLVSRFMINSAAKVRSSRELQASLAREIIKERRKNPCNRKDLLNAMIKGRDPKSGQGMPDDLITANMITFLVAGHETTSSLLSFTMYSLLKNASAYREAQEEVDRVIGTGSIIVGHLKDLKYLNAVLRESIRLYPPAPGISLQANANGDSHFALGDHIVQGNPSIVVLMEKVHRDPEVYGEDAEEFKPERMLDARFDKLPKNSWKPFGNGARSCIGRAFAWQEALLAMAILLQRFNFRLDDPSYHLKMQFNLTIKPKDLYIRATLRGGLDATTLEHAMNAPPTDGTIKSKGRAFTSPRKAESASATQRLSILYGSNTGTCEALSQRLISDAGIHGFVADSSPLDDSLGSLPMDWPVIIITSSYEGQPPDNAARFMEWLNSLSAQELEGTRYAVFGCGHHDWQDTFYRIPKLVDEVVAARGGTRIAPLGRCDVAHNDVLDQFDAWKAESLWPALAPSGLGAVDQENIRYTIEMEISTNKRSLALKQELSQAVVLEAKTLTSSGEPQKRHLELKLPPDMSYRPGDYLAVLPLNPILTVRRVLKCFAFPVDVTIKLSSDSMTTLPTDTWVSAHDVLRGLVELSQPASKKDIRRLASLASDPNERVALEGLASKGSTPEDTRQHISILDLLERFSSIALPFSEFLSLLPPLRIRIYSISSFSLGFPTVCSITYSVLNTPGDSTWTSAGHTGVASNYLSTLSPDDRVHVTVRPNKSGFHLPPVKLAATTPIIMICAGTGLAPFRGLVQERLLQMRAHSGVKLAPALLFVGCRSSTGDRLYADEIDAWEKEGAVELRYAFSREVKMSAGCRYVQDRISMDKAEVRKLWDDGAKVYICGASRVVREVSSVLNRVLFEDKVEKERMALWLKAKRGERVVTEMFE